MLDTLTVGCEDNMTKTGKIIICVFLGHVIASMAGSIAFDWSLHKFMPEETQGGDLPFWSLFSAPMFVPLRILVAIQGTIMGGRITLFQTPFAILTGTYLLILVGFIVGLSCLLKRKGSKNTQL